MKAVIRGEGMDEPSWKAHAIREDESTVRIKKHGSMKVDAMMVADQKSSETYRPIDRDR